VEDEPAVIVDGLTESDTEIEPEGGPEVTTTEVLVLELPPGPEHVSVYTKPPAAVSGLSNVPELLNGSEPPQLSPLAPPVPVQAVAF